MDPDWIDPSAVPRRTFLKVVSATALVGWYGDLLPIVQEDETPSGTPFDPANQPPVTITPECACKVSVCCVCEKATRAGALKVTLTGRGNDQMEVVLKTGTGGTGPEFDRRGGGRLKNSGKVGNQVMPLKCTTPGTTYLFDIYGGPKGGEFDVAVRKRGNQASEKVCGKLCVYGNARWSQPLAFDPGPPPNLKPAFPYDGANCLGNRPAWLKPNQAYYEVDRPVPKTVYLGKSSNAAPFNGRGAPRLLMTYTYACSTVQLWCVGSNFKFLLRDGCDPNSPFIKVGECVFTNGKNRFQVKLADCNGRKEPVKTRLFNVATLTRPRYQFTFWRFDRCTGVRESVRFGGAGILRPWRKKSIGDWGGIEHGIVDSSPGTGGGVSSDSRPPAGTPGNVERNP